VVSTVRTTVCALDPLMVTEAGIVHVAGSPTAMGVIAQLRLITPVKPSKSVKLIVEVFPIVAPGVTFIAVVAVATALEIQPLAAASGSIVSVDETVIALL
jgi:hypothetical protein